MRKLLKVLVVIVCVVIAIPVLFLVFIHFNDFKPKSESRLPVLLKTNACISSSTSFSLISWNIGYCGLGKEMDFFYDGGTQVRASKELSQKYLDSNLNFIKFNDTIDFWFFQEVDKNSKRSYFVNQVDKLVNILANHNSVYTVNYDVSFVPMPLGSPMGKVEAGMMTFSKYQPSQQLRIGYPNIAPWPEKLFLLDRCLILIRIPLPEGKDLVLINTHNSFFIDDESLRMIELNVMKKVMLEEYEKGNYVVAGGDWNKYPSRFLSKTDIDKNILQSNVKELNSSFLPEDWKYAYDKSVVSNRDLLSPLNGKTSFSVIDFFVVSPNIKVDEIQCVDLKFENSDHNPIKLNFSLLDD